MLRTQNQANSKSVITATNSSKLTGAEPWEELLKS